MKKSELKNLIQIYSEIKNEIFKKSEIADIKKGGRVIKINIKPWMYKFPEYLYLIKENENCVIGEIIKRSIEKGEKDLKIWQTTAVSESTYYRLKKQIIDKIYNLYILAGDVRLDEILAEKIE